MSAHKAVPVAEFKALNPVFPSSWPLPIEPSS